MRMRVAGELVCWGWCFTLALGASACVRSSDDEGLGAVDAGAGSSPGGTGGTGGSPGSAGSGGTLGYGYPRDAGRYEPPPPPPTCPTQPDGPDAALQSIPAVYPDNFWGSVVEGISADGRTVVGRMSEGTFDGRYPSSRQRAFRWTLEEGAVPLDVPPSSGDSSAFAASADGSVIVGEVVPSVDRDYNHAVVWRSGVLSELEELEGQVGSRAVAVNDDGTVIAGFQFNISTDGLGQPRRIPVRWTAAGVEVLTRGAGEALATDVSGDGAKFAGYGGTYPLHALRWSAVDSVTELLLPDAREHYAYAISRDGSVVVGAVGSAFDAQFEAFRWQGSETELLGMQLALGVDADGSTIVGVTEGTALVWDRPHGVRQLSRVVDGLGADLSTWTLESADAVSADGRTIAGNGYCGTSDRGFLARLPPDEAEVGSADAGPDANTP